MKLIFASFHVVLFSPEVIPREDFFINPLPISLFGKFTFIVSPETIKLKFLSKEIRNKLRLLHFPINNTKALRNYQSFYDRGVLKRIWKIYSTMWDVISTNPFVYWRRVSRTTLYALSSHFIIYNFFFLTSIFPSHIIKISLE